MCMNKYIIAIFNGENTDTRTVEARTIKEAEKMARAIVDFENGEEFSVELYEEYDIYAEIEYSDFNTMEAQEGCKFDDINYLRRREQ